MATRVLISSPDRLHCWQTGWSAAVDVVLPTGLYEPYDIDTIDGDNWYMGLNAKAGADAGKLYRYTWGAGLTDLGIIGTVDDYSWLMGVKALGAARVLTGYDDPHTANYGVREYNAGVETDHTTFNARVPALELDSAGNVYSAERSTGPIWQWPGAGVVWNSFAAAPEAWYMCEDIAVLSPTEVWSCGLYQVGPEYHGAIRFWNGAVWAAQFNDPTDILGNVNSISVVSATDGWACNWKGELLHFDGVTWSVAVGAAGVSNARVYALSATEVYVVGWLGGELQLCSYNGSAWTTIEVATLAGEGGGVSVVYAFPVDLPPIKLPAAGLYIDEIRG